MLLTSRPIEDITTEARHSQVHKDHKTTEQCWRSVNGGNFFSLILTFYFQFSLTLKTVYTQLKDIYGGAPTAAKEESKLSKMFGGSQGSEKAKSGMDLLGNQMKATIQKRMGRDLEMVKDIVDGLRQGLKVAANQKALIELLDNNEGYLGEYDLYQFITGKLKI